MNLFIFGMCVLCFLIFAFLFYFSMTTSDDELEEMGITPSSKRYESNEQLCPHCGKDINRP